MDTLCQRHSHVPVDGCLCPVGVWNTEFPLCVWCVRIWVFSILVHVWTSDLLNTGIHYSRLVLKFWMSTRHSSGGRGRVLQEKRNSPIISGRTRRPPWLLSYRRKVRVHLLESLCSLRRNGNKWWHMRTGNKRRWRWVELYSHDAFVRLWRNDFVFFLKQSPRVENRWLTHSRACFKMKTLL